MRRLLLNAAEGDPVRAWHARFRSLCLPEALVMDLGVADPLTLLTRRPPVGTAPRTPERAAKGRQFVNRFERNSSSDVSRLITPKAAISSAALCQVSRANVVGSGLIASGRIGARPLSEIRFMTMLIGRGHQHLEGRRSW